MLGEFIGAFHMAKKINKLNDVNWEKIGIYFGVLTGFMTIMFYIIDMKVDIAKLQIIVEKLEERK